MRIKNSNNYSNNRSKSAVRRKPRSESKIWCFIMLLAVICVVSFLITTGASATRISYTELYSVGYGDTLWDIAAKCNTEAADVRNVMDDIMLLNNMKTPQLQVGQSIVIPIY